MRVLVTGGNTVVPIDQVRCISNVFRGRTGANIAMEACRRGHHVHLLASDPEVLRPEDKAALPADRWRLERYRTFDHLHEAMRRAIEGDKVDAVIHSAAVSDYRVEGIFAPVAGAKFSLETLLNLPNVKDLHTSFSLGEVKAGAALPLAHLEAAAGRGSRDSE